MALRDAMRESAAQYLRPGEPIQAVFGAQTASPLLAGLTGIFVFLGLNKYRIVAVTPDRTQIRAGSETLRVHRRFYKDIEAADSALTAA